MASAKCPKCGESFANSSSRDWHVKNEHLNDLKGPANIEPYTTKNNKGESPNIKIGEGVDNLAKKFDGSSRNWQPGETHGDYKARLKRLGPAPKSHPIFARTTRRDLMLTSEMVPDKGTKETPKTPGAVEIADEHRRKDIAGQRLAGRLRAVQNWLGRQEDESAPEVAARAEAARKAAHVEINADLRNDMKKHVLFRDGGWDFTHSSKSQSIGEAGSGWLKRHPDQKN